MLTKESHPINFQSETLSKTIKKKVMSTDWVKLGNRKIIIAKYFVLVSVETFCDINPLSRKPDMENYLANFFCTLVALYYRKIFRDNYFSVSYLTQVDTINRPNSNNKQDIDNSWKDFIYNSYIPVFWE